MVAKNFPFFDTQSVSLDVHIKFTCFPLSLAIH